MAPFASRPDSAGSGPIGNRARNVWVFWNWKSALLSVMLRVPVFAVAAARHGLEAVAAAVLTESVACGFNAGCYAAVVQTIRNRKPVWLTALLTTVGMPAVRQVLEYEGHFWRGRPPPRVCATLPSVRWPGCPPVRHCPRVPS